MLPFEVGFEKLLVFLNGHFDQPRVIGVGLLDHVSRNFIEFEFGAEIFVFPDRPPSWR